jgi:hypothetical protein
MVAASMKDIISVLGMSVAPSVEQPGRAIEPRASRRTFRRTGTDRYGVSCRGLDEIALIAVGILTGEAGAGSRELPGIFAGPTGRHDPLLHRCDLWPVFKRALLEEKLKVVRADPSPRGK